MSPPSIFFNSFLFNFFILILFELLVDLYRKYNNISLKKEKIGKISAADHSTALIHKNNVYEKNYLLLSRSENQTCFYKIIQRDSVSIVYISCKDFFRKFI